MLGATRGRYEDGLQVNHEGMEVYKDGTTAQTQNARPWSDVPTKNETGKKSIMGLSRPIFIVIIILIALIVGAAIGGGVGGSMAVQQAKSASNAGSIGASGSTMTSTTTVTITQATATVTAAGSSQTLDYNNYAPLAPLSVTNLAFTCPTGNIQGSLNTTAYFKPYCNQNMVNGGDFTALIAYSITDCIDACLSANLNYGSNKCKGVTFATKLAYMMKNHIGSNCFLKQNSEPMDSSPPDFTAYTFKLCTDSSCSSVFI